MHYRKWEGLGVVGIGENLAAENDEGGRKIIRCKITQQTDPYIYMLVNLEKYWFASPHIREGGQPGGINLQGSLLTYGSWAYERP